jgi:hypothetical protein
MRCVDQARKMNTCCTRGCICPSAQFIPETTERFWMLILLDIPDSASSITAIENLHALK